MPRVRIRLLWHKQAQFAGYLIAEELGLGRGRGVEIICEGLDFAVKPVDAVLDGISEMCVASPAHILESRAPESLRWILAIQQESPLVYPVRKSTGLATLADFAGQRVGVWPGGEDLELRWMLHGAGLTNGAVIRIEMPDTVGPFLRGEIASAQMTSYHELHQVETALGAEEIALFRGADTGRTLLKDGLVASRALVDNHPQTVQAVVDAVLEGWTIAFTDPDRALAICASARPDMPLEEHAAQLADIRALSLSGAALIEGLGVPDAMHLAKAAEAIAAVDGHDVATGAILERRFFDNAPPAFRKSDWA
jgi:NitT/TauT family transport system substrate-binding protein